MYLFNGNEYHYREDYYPTTINVPKLNGSLVMLEDKEGDGNDIAVILSFDPRELKLLSAIFLSRVLKNHAFKYEFPLNWFELQNVDTKVGEYEGCQITLKEEVKIALHHHYGRHFKIYN